MLISGLVRDFIENEPWVIYLIICVSFLDCILERGVEETCISWKLTWLMPQLALEESNDKTYREEVYRYYGMLGVWLQVQSPYRLIS